MRRLHLTLTSALLVLPLTASLQAQRLEGVWLRDADPAAELVFVDTATVAWVRADTGRRVSVEYSDWYGRRVTIHRYASYATLPLFAAQYVAGRQLFEKSDAAPAWAVKWHGPLATGVATLFAVNTVTGGWNLWEGRKDPEGRKWRTTHAALMLLADAGFTATGLLADRAERSAAMRRTHRDVAVSSMAVALASYLMMLPPLRRD